MRRWFLLGLTLLAAGCATAKPRSYLSSYAEMRPASNLDKVYVASDARFGRYRTLTLEVVNKTGSGGALGEQKTDSLVRRFRQDLEDALRQTRAFQEIRTDAAADSSLTLHVFVTDLNPGSHMLRAMVGFGAGAARVEVEGEAIDSSSGASLLRFADARSGDDLLSLQGSEPLMEEILLPWRRTSHQIFTAHQ